MKRETLTTKTRRLLTERKRTLTLRVIAEETGLTEHWLSKFQRGEIKDGTAERIQTLYEHLTGKRLGY